jgi:hypothetical protein
MQAYERPMVEDLGTVAEFTQALGMGGGSDSQFPILANYAPRLNDAITHS